VSGREEAGVGHLAQQSVARHPSSVGAALRAGYERLAGLDAPAVTAQALLAHVLGLTRTQVLSQPERRLTEAQSAAYAELADRAADGEPLAYLTGEREFYGLAFEVNRHVLVPRPETEALVALALAEPAGRVADVGAGSGCIAVTLAVHWPDAQVCALDLSVEALSVARRNAARHGVEARVACVESDLLGVVLSPVRAGAPPAAMGALGLPPLTFDLICANLPYVDGDELRRLPVARHEPRLALDGGAGGVELIERLLSEAPPLLPPGGRLLLEIGATQGAAVAALAGNAFPGARVAVHRDHAGLDRVVAVTLALP
jgi:release factor glutamine methyltransferase